MFHNNLHFHTDSYSKPLPKLELDKNRRRVKHCPCGKSNKDGKFVPFKGYDDKGYCHSCGKTFLPELPKKGLLVNKPETVKMPSQPVSYISIKDLEDTLTDYYKNNFVLYLVGLFGVDLADELVNNYHIGTSSLWYGANIFWQIDYEGKIRTGKIMLYNARTGKRVKKPFSHISWAHLSAKTGGKKGFKLQQCFFGEHLLKGYSKPVAVVESEKTAVIASAYLPQFVWLATGSITNLKAEKCQVLAGRDVVLFPDLNAYDKWEKVAADLERLLPHSRFSVSGLLNSKASEKDKQQGLDLADYLVRFDWRDFQTGDYDSTERGKQESGATEVPEVVKVEQKGKETIHKMATPGLTDFTGSFVFPVPAASPVFQPGKEDSGELPAEHQKNIEALEAFFNDRELPSGKFRLNEWTTLVDIPLFVESHWAALKSYCGKKLFKPYHDRLAAFKEKLIRGENNT